MRHKVLGIFLLSMCLATGVLFADSDQDGGGEAEVELPEEEKSEEKPPVPAGQQQPEVAKPSAIPAPTPQKAEGAPATPPMPTPEVTQAPTQTPSPAPITPAAPAQAAPVTPPAQAPQVAPPAKPQVPAPGTPASVQPAGAMPAAATPPQPATAPRPAAAPVQSPVIPKPNVVLEIPAGQPAVVEIESILPAAQAVPVAPKPVPAVTPTPAAAPMPQAVPMPIAPPAKPMVGGAQPVQPQVAPGAGAKPAEEVKPEGIDTVNLAEPSGNWLYKRIWWEKAEHKYEKIRNLVESIFESRMTFFTQRTELDRSVFDPFYLNAGLGRGELEELLNYLMSEMEAQRAKMGSLNEEERAFLNVMTQEKETLEQLKLDIEAISKIDAAMDDALSKLMEQLNLCRNYEQKAWEAFKEIAQVLNDKKARELFYAMVTYEDNIAAIGNYIKNPFAAHFGKLTATAKEHVQRVQATIQKLKEKGIDFKKKAKELENQMSAEERERIRREKEEELEREREEAEAAKGWGNWILGIFKSIGNSITGAISSVYSTIMGWFGKAPEEEVETEEESALQRATKTAPSSPMPLPSPATPRVPAAPVLPSAPITALEPEPNEE